MPDPGTQHADLASLVETIDQGCPICSGIVKGNDKYLFFCRSCNMLFHRRHLRKAQEKLKHMDER